MRTIFRSTLIITLLINVFGCKTNQHKNVVRLSDTKRIVFLDSLTAASAITTDNSEGYFALVQPVEMSIQIKKKLDKGLSRDNQLAGYQDFMRTEVCNFSANEQRLVQRLMGEVYATCQKVGVHVFPQEVRLIKTHGNHYGEGVYYTRDNAIVIPKDALKGDEEALLHTLFHELSHIYTRQNAAKKQQLYQLIGFVPLQQSLIFPDALQQKILYNPDGINLNWVIHLADKQGKKLDAVPIIAANESGFQENKKRFFDYLVFNLYAVEYRDNAAHILANTDGSSALSLKELPDFFRQIKGNTNYIIHPDEIIADNFTFVMYGVRDAKSLEKYSPEGRKLLSDIKEVLQK
ncbi:MAG: hypothetical protein KA974_09305 [Saprospiraceae bacterium]|nr:hypothetical protein [Saprospiraceae bacterium]MBP7679992.1 hypothetical protein [Saprospiraceae bacterium]